MTMSANALSINIPMSTPTPKGRVLCVDDEPNILRALSWLLKKEFQVVTALSAQEGLELIRTGDFDVVISDQRMPEMSGVDFLNQVRIMAPRAMRILLTGYSDMQAVLRSVNEAEIFRYVNKPWNVNELPAIVAQAAEIARKQENIPAPTSWHEEENEVTPLQNSCKLMVIDDDESVHAAVEMSAGDLAQIIHVTNPVDALRMLETENIGVILAERTLGSMDLTHLLCLLKQRHPQIVSIMLTDTMDSVLIAKLINQGQIYRFLQKPAKAGQLRLTLKSALLKRTELLNNPALTERHKVDTADLAENTSMQPDPTEQSTGTVSPAQASQPANTPIFAIFGNFMRRVFGS